MDSFVTIVGWLVVFGLVVAIAAFLCIAAFYGALALADAMKERGDHQARVRISEQLRSAAHWFSEHPPTSKLIQEYAERVILYYGNDPSAVRSKWRENMKKEKDPT